MIEIMKVDGGNNYRLPHMSKGKLEREGRLPERLGCDYALVQQVIQQK